MLQTWVRHLKKKLNKKGVEQERVNEGRENKTGAIGRTSKSACDKLLMCKLPNHTLFSSRTHRNINCSHTTTEAYKPTPVKVKTHKHRHRNLAWHSQEPCQRVWRRIKPNRRTHPTPYPYNPGTDRRHGSPAHRCRWPSQCPYTPNGYGCTCSHLECPLQKRIEPSQGIV